MEDEIIEAVRIAAMEGDAEAQLKLGERYFVGAGVDQDDKVAAAWYRKAADQGNAEAQYLMGRLYHCGIVVEQSYEKAVDWYSKAEEQGHEHAKFHIQNHRFLLRDRLRRK